MKYFLIVEPWAQYETLTGELGTFLGWCHAVLVRRAGQMAIIKHPKSGEEIQFDTRDPKVHIVSIEPSQEY